MAAPEEEEEAVITPNRPDEAKLRGLHDPEDVWKAADTDQLLDYAYTHHLPGFGPLPPKNAQPYQVISSDAFSRLRTVDWSVPEKEGIRKRFFDVGVVNNLVWIQWARPSGNLAGLLWLARNFTIIEERLVDIFRLAATQGKVDPARQIYEAYKDKVDWPQLVASWPPGKNNPFEESLLEDRAAFANWMAETFDMAPLIIVYGAAIFTDLIYLNNAAAVKWLIEKYDPPVNIVFRTSDAKKIGWELWVMGHSGRAELSQFLSNFYQIQPIEPSVRELRTVTDLKRKPPPPSKRESLVFLKRY